VHCLADVEGFKTVITIGNFDGVHTGHQSLVKKVIERAQVNNCKSVVITFNMHPYHLLYPEMKPYLLTSSSNKERRLIDLGIDYVCPLEFTPELSEMSANDFLKDIIIDHLNAVEVVIGYDARFGKDREGDYSFLKKMEETYNYKTIFVDSQKNDDDVVSSSLMRALLRDGNLGRATELMGYHYGYQGTVVRGKQIGHRINFPTLNIVPLAEHQLIPATGIYLSRVKIEGILYWGATNIGYSPTIKTEQKLEVEMFVFDFDRDIYGQNIEIEFIQRLRSEEKFASIDELIEQIGEDVKYAKSLIPLYKN